MPMNNRSTPGYSPILHARSENYFWKGKGALSIKTFKKGRAFYHAGHGHFAVDEGNFFLLNHGQEYSITIESEVPVESFCIFFPELMVEEVYHNMMASNEQLLDDPAFLKRESVEFVEKTYNDTWLAAPLFQIKSEYTNQYFEITWLEEKLYELAHGLLKSQRQVNKEILKLQSIRASTREELYKRIQIGHEFISAYFDQSITLTDVAKAACLSPNHFLRSYKQLFGMSPHQYLSERRLQKSKSLLLQTDKSITDICLEVGFQSPSSFSGLFSKRFSMTPSQFRQKK